MSGAATTPDYELTPSPPPVRVVGPGRAERSYQRRIRALEDRLESTDSRAQGLTVELDVAQRLERGCQHLLDRLEVRADKDRERLDRAEQREKRLALALGALQRESELLRERLTLAEGERPALAAKPRRPQRRPRRTWLARLLSRPASA